MRSIYVVLLIAILASSSLGCGASSSQTDIQETVTIKTSYEKPESLNNKETILLDGLLEGDEYIEMIVVGEIFDVEQVAIILDETTNQLVEKETVKTIKKIANQTLLIKTYQPEGIPSEKIKWKSSTGKSYEYIIQENGGMNNNITKFEMTEEK